jgi:hypothetical protein
METAPHKLIFATTGEEIETGDLLRIDDPLEPGVPRYLVVDGIAGSMLTIRRYFGYENFGPTTKVPASSLGIVWDYETINSKPF